MTLPDVRFTATEAGPLLDVEARTIQQWVRRGKLSPAGYTPGGTQLFAWPDLVAARTVSRRVSLDPIRPVTHPQY